MSSETNGFDKVSQRNNGGRWRADGRRVTEGAATVVKINEHGAAAEGAPMEREPRRRLGLTEGAATEVRVDGGKGDEAFFLLSLSSADQRSKELVRDEGLMVVSGPTDGATTEGAHRRFVNNERQRRERRRW
ncbi:hypothetical protein PIB30_060904 [Stylosanthes scabra]|uniref:Uncharacterized protein n=1 Tax=Stylosanthes scabra TaxID=79078 RepID=A0ABU6XLE6_9FABA|nr:hypothetical protein [Stylosanthes scabra]